MTEIKDINPLIYGNLDPEVIDICDRALEKIKEVREMFSRPVATPELFEAAEFLLSFRSWLTKHLFEAEARYRYEVKRIQDEDEKKSVARAEAEAKTTDEYRAWRYLDRADKLADEQTKLVKKFSQRMEDEFLSSR